MYDLFNAPHSLFNTPQKLIFTSELYKLLYTIFRETNLNFSIDKLQHILLLNNIGTQHLPPYFKSKYRPKLNSDIPKVFSRSVVTLKEHQGIPRSLSFQTHHHPSSKHLHTPVLQRNTTCASICNK